MSLTARLVSRFKAEFGSRIVAMIASGLLMVSLARLLGPDEYGLLFLAISVFTTIGIFAKLGIAKSGARYVAEYKENEPEQLPHILRTSIRLNLVAIGVVTVAVAITHREIAGFLGEPGLRPFLLIGVFYLLFEALSTYTRLILQGLEKIQLAATLHALNRVCRLVFAIGFVLLGFSALGALIGYILSFVITTTVGLAIIYRRVYKPHAGSSAIADDLRRRIGEYSIPLTATSTANVLDKELDTVLVGYFINPVAVSYYVISKQVIQFVETPATALGFTLSPTFGSQKADGNVEQAARIYETALTNSLLLYIPIAAGLVLVAEPALALFFGDEYMGAVPVLQVLGLYAILQSITRITSNGLDFLGRARERAIAKGGTAVLNVGLNLVLIPVIGVVGAALATVITYSLYTFANVYIIHQEFDLRIGYIGWHVSRTVIVTGVMALIVYATVDFIDGFLSLALVVLLGVTVWGVLSTLTGLLDVKQIRTHGNL